MPPAKKLILLVDDEEHNRELYKDAFEEEEDCEVVVAKDGLEAFQMAKQRKFDAICTDFRMPKLDGAKLLAALKDTSQKSDTPMVVITGFKEEAIDEIKKNDLMNSLTLMEKPVSPSKLVQTVRPMLSLVKTQTTTPSKVADPKLLMPFTQALTLTLKSIGQVKQVKAQEAQVLPDQKRIDADYTGAFSIVSVSVRGTAFVSFPKATLLKVAGKIMGKDFTEVTPEVEEAMKDFTNIFYGNTKRVFLEQGTEFQTSSPTLVRGVGHSVMSYGEAAIISACLETDLGPVYLQFSTTG